MCLGRASPALQSHCATRLLRPSRVAAGLSLALPAQRFDQRRSFRRPDELVVSKASVHNTRWDIVELARHMEVAKHCQIATGAASRKLLLSASTLNRHAASRTCPRPAATSRTRAVCSSIPDRGVRRQPAQILEAIMSPMKQRLVSNSLPPSVLSQCGTTVSESPNAASRSRPWIGADRRRPCRSRRPARLAGRQRWRRRLPAPAMRRAMAPAAVPRRCYPEAAAPCRKGCLGRER